MTWRVQSFIPGSSPREIHSVEEYDNELDAHEDYYDRSISIRDHGGAAELIHPDGSVMASTMRPIGKP